MNERISADKMSIKPWDVFDPDSFKTFNQLHESCPFIYTFKELSKYEVYMEVPQRTTVVFVQPQFPGQYLQPDAAIRCFGIPHGDMWLIVSWNKFRNSVKDAKKVNGRGWCPVTKKTRWVRCIVEKGTKYKYVVKIVQQWTEETKDEFYALLRELKDDALY